MKFKETMTEAVKGKVGKGSKVGPLKPDIFEPFTFEGTKIINPSLDESGLYKVDSVKYYGKKNIKLKTDDATVKYLLSLLNNDH